MSDGIDRTPTELFRIDLEEGCYLNALMWPDQMGFVGIRDPENHLRRGSGFRGVDQAENFMTTLLEEWARDFCNGIIKSEEDTE